MWPVMVLVAVVCCTATGNPVDDFLPLVTWTPGSTIHEGETVLLQCQVGGGSDAPAIWLKLDPQSPNNDEIISHGELVIMEDPRLHVRHHADTNTFVLAIRGVSPSDAGRYQCRVPVSSQETELRAAPPITITLSGGSRSNGHSSCSRLYSTDTAIVCWASIILCSFLCILFSQRIHR